MTPKPSTNSTQPTNLIFLILISLFLLSVISLFLTIIFILPILSKETHTNSKYKHPNYIVHQGVEREKLYECQDSFPVCHLAKVIFEAFQIYGCWWLHVDDLWLMNPSLFSSCLNFMSGVSIHDFCSRTLWGFLILCWNRCFLVILMLLCWWLSVYVFDSSHSIRNILKL